MIVPTKLKSGPDEAENLLGDFSGLLEKIGLRPEAGFFENSDLPFSIKNLKSLKNFLGEYQQHILIPIEWPAIYQAYFHAARHQARELIALDQRLASEPRLKIFAAASQRVGRNQLQRLKPLRDHRLAQRYLESVESKKSHGWHTLVYGITLAIYSLPLRQGLALYAEQTLRGFSLAAARDRHFSENKCRDLIQERISTLPVSIEKILQQRDFLSRAI
ncbi:MAG: urease accessory UreF family protein [Limisphaerales bacterium]